VLAKIKELLQKKPGLKAKEIAKKIDKDKKLVNSFLYANPGVFVIDENYFWSLVVTSEVVIKFEANKWVDCNSFETSINNSGSLFESKYNSIIFVVPEECSILLETAARLLALCNQLVQKDKAIKIDFSNCKKTLGYFDRMGFLEHLDERVNVIPKRPSISGAQIYQGNSNAVVEFGAVNPKNSNKVLINQLIDRFIQQSGNAYEIVASTIFGELIGNIQEHSKSSMFGFAALQKYEGKGKHRKHIQTIISDSGLGIAATLKPSLKDNYPYLYKLRNDDDFELKLVTAVFTKGEISRFGSGRGLGFKSSREQAAKFNARLSVRQQNFSLELEYRDGEMTRVIEKTNLSTIYGTHLCFDFFVD